MRAPRRTFATPLVVTVLGAACSAPPRPAPEPVRPPVTTGSAAAGSGGTAPPPQAAVQRWIVSRSADGCVAAYQVECPRPSPGGAIATCNPPRPIPYVCPDDVTADHPIEIRRFGGAPDCFAVPPPIDCPAGATCNPPPPRRLACPE